MDRDRKIAQLRMKYEKLKKKIKDWELAVFKTEGRKPGKDDMKSAPHDVQESYRDLVKIRKYLEEISSTAEKGDTILTPGKIFFGKQRRQLQRTDHAYLIRTPAKSLSKSKFPHKAQNEVPEPNPSLGLRSSKNSTSSTKKEKDKETTGPSFLPFKKLFSTCKLSEFSESSLNKSMEQKKHKSIFVKDDSNLLVERKVLIPDRLLKGNKSSEPDFPSAVSMEQRNLLNTCADATPPKPDENNLRNKNVEGSYTPHKNNDSTSFKLKSPQFKGRTSFRTSKLLDSGWLARVKDSENDKEEQNMTGEQRCFVDDGFSNGPETSMPLGASEIETMQTSFQNEEICFTTDESEANATNSHKIVSDPINANIEQGPDNSDSGICVNSFFSSEDVRRAVEEVMNETSQNNTSVISDADGSLLYSFSEDACLPSDPEEFSTVNTNEISNLIKSLDSISDDEETSKSTLCSSNGSSGNTGGGTKRPASYAFSPSPEKPDLKRKFFKSSTGKRSTRATFSMGSYKPSSPRKRKNAITSKSNNVKEIKNVATPTTTENNCDRKDFMNRKQSADRKKSDEEVLHPQEKVEITKRSMRSKKPIVYQESEDNDVSRNKTAGRNSSAVDIFDEVSQPQFTVKRKRGQRYKDSNKTLESKLSTGKVEDNYVRIDTTKKVFVRGHRKISAVKLKRLDYKHRKSAQRKEPSKTTFTCNKCGEAGHFAKFCMKDNTADEFQGEQDDSPFPSLEEAAKMVYKNTSSVRINIYTSKTNEQTDGDNGVENSSENCSSDVASTVNNIDTSSCSKLIECVEPFFSCEDSTPLMNTAETEESIMKEGIQAFGYDDFRHGQREAIHRVLKGLSTLLILSTGSGKSLCYQLPAYLYQKKYPGALTLCISPLVSLMEDQVQGIPAFLNAACLHGGMTVKQREVVLDKVRSKKLHILLVSPEAVCGGLFGLLRGNNIDFPKISFACIDEVHCVSQWSHNFRPSYLQLCKILREKLNVGVILGLTATATESTARSICEHLQIDPSTTIRGELIPKNLQLTVSRDIYKDEALMNLLRGERFRDCDSIIVYCTRREQCERIATLIRTKMQEISTHKTIKTKSGARLSGSCEAYHAGMTPRRRKNVQNGFMSGDIRIVVATVAFGMGIDKSDIRAVIHYNMPSAFESYVQEIGRAGRDGLPAHCHLFLDSSRRNDLCELKRHVYANSVDRPTVRKLLRKVFQSCKCKRIEQLRGGPETSSECCISSCAGHEVSFSIDKTVMDLDLPKENITTLLCYLELGDKKWIEILPLTYELCKIQSYGGAKMLKAAASRCPPLAVAIALQKEKKKFCDTDTYLEFNVIEAAATVGWNSNVVKKELKNLEWVASQFDDKGNGTRFRKSGLLVEFSSLAYRVKSPGSLSDDEADMVLNSLHERNLRQEQTELYQLQRVYHALLSVSFPNVNNLCDTFDDEKSNHLKKFIYDYFSESNDNMQTDIDAVHSDVTLLDPGKEEDLRRSIRQLIDSNRDLNFTTRSIAKIFQGISSPCFPADVWYRNKDFWRRYLDIDFHTICSIASMEL